MLQRIIHPTWRLVTLPLAATLALAGPASALAAHEPRPTPEPLWDAYPLDPGLPTSTAPPQAPALFDSAPESQGQVNRPTSHHAPLAVTVIFFGAMAALVACTAVALPPARRRRRRVRSAGPPNGARRG